MNAPDARGRYVCAAGTINMRAMVALLRDNGYGAYRLPRVGLDGTVGTMVARLAAFGQSAGARQYLRTHLGRVPRFDTTKIRRDLAMTFRPIDRTILDTAADLEQWGHVPPRRR
jgi:dihydroflavonol-4-reductase